MKFEDIIYKLTDKTLMPEVMGTMAKYLHDWSKSIKCYEDSIPEVREIMEKCKNFNLEDEIENMETKEEAPFGFIKKYVHFFIIETLKETDITYFPRINQQDNRHWINGNLAFIGEENKFYTITLKKGYNIFCVEHVFDNIPIISIEKMNKSDDSIISLTRDNYWYHPGNFIINHKTEFIQEDQTFEFSLMPLDLINQSYSSKIKMLVSLEEKEVILYEMDVNFKQEYKIDLSFIPNMGEDEYKRLFVYFQVENNDASISEKYIILYRFDTNPEYTDAIKKSAAALLDKNDVPELIKNEIHYCINKLESKESEIHYGRFLKNILTAEKHNLLNKYLYKPGAHTIYYYAVEDDNYYYYYVVIPKDFDPSKEYPLLLTFSHGHIDNFSDIQHSSNYSARFAEREGVIYADIGGRGCILGSYTGEICLLKEIEHLLKNFPINKKRIYAIAHCAGNQALSNFAQIHPHLFAGIYTRTATFYENNINNLYNLSCMHLIASVNETAVDALHIKRKTIEKELKDFKFLFANRYYNKDGTDLILLQYTKQAIDMLMSKELDEYPEIIYYRTENNRSRQAYYIEIESIEKGKTFAEFNSEIVTYNLVIKTINCTGLKITIPPQVDREDFAIKINGKTLKFRKYYKNEIFLKYKKTGFELVDNFDENIEFYNGRGLLDVYLSPIRIINCNLNDNILANVSNTFAKPISNAAYPLIYVDYPIKSIDDMMNYNEYALIIIDNNCRANKNLTLIRDLLPIKMNENGYCYKGNSVEGKYCIMQVIANPWNNERSILYINTNDKKLYNKNLFTRKMIIPTYGNGFHPYLNGVALLFEKNTYYSVRTWGENFIKVNKY